MAVVHSLYREAATPRIDEATCKHCGQCVQVCPTEALVSENGIVRLGEHSKFGCFACGHCMMVCPEGSLTVEGRGISADDLLPLPPPEARASADALEALLLSRRSVRRFGDREVEPEVLERVLRMAASAPMGIPPWDVGCLVVGGRERVHELAGQIVGGYQGMLRVFRPWLLSALRPLMKRATYDQFSSLILPLAKAYADGWAEGRDLLFYDAPAVLLFHASPYADGADATIACTYAMLAAESLGLGSTIIGGAPPILQRNVKLSQSLGVPAGSRVVVALILGYPAVHYRRAVQRHFTSIGTS